jgi:ATP-dependent protease ClpP protease subunit
MRACLILITCIASLALSGCTGGAFSMRGYVPGAAVETTPSRDITISGVITQETANTVLDELANQPGPVVTINLDSPGGDVSAAFQIHDRLKRDGRLVVTSVADGARCMSSCTLIFAAGNRRLAGSQSRFRFHAPLYVGRLPLPGPMVDVIEAMTRRGIANTYAEASPEFARYLAEPDVLALHSRKGLALSGEELVSRGGNFVTGTP